MNSEFESIFARLRGILLNYSGSLEVSDDRPGHYCLEVVFSPKLKKAFPVAWVKIVKGYVSYHFMPVYLFPKLCDGLSKKLRAWMQGKSCFNFKVVDEALSKELEQVTADGFAACRKAGFAPEHDQSVEQQGTVATFAKPVKKAGASLLLAVVVLLTSQGCQHQDSVSSGAAPGAERSSKIAPRDDAASRAAFLAAYSVLTHPRCLNCHPKGDQPLQGEDSHIHLQNVQRGSDGKGLFAMKCANCHQLKNLSGENMPPGHPEWHLPPANMRMVFEGKTPAELARQLKDPKLNGGKTLEQIVHHSAEDSLVATGWQPGPGRSTPPLSQAEFGKKMREWVDRGAAIPE